MSDLITRCPKCATAFRISESLIKSAQGVVRCGSCLNVFNAKEYLVKQTPPPTNTSTRRSMSKVINDLEQLAKTSKPTHTPTQTTDLKLKKPGPGEQQQKLKKPTTDSSTLFERPPESEGANPNTQDETVDESWALELLKESDDGADTIDIQTRKTTHPEPTTSDTQKAEARESAARATQAPPATSDSALATKEHSLEADDLTAPAPGHNEQPPATVEPAMLIDSIATIEFEPLESRLNERKAPLLQRLSWALATTVALALLVGQIAWLQYHKLNKTEPYRSAYAAACTVLNCQLPDMKDRTQIQASNLLIRSHPKTEGALLVDVILQNKAPFKQTFPGLRLTFTDLRNEPIMTRRFTPEEYLGGELTGQTMMPTQQAIHIAVEIVDPGPKAVSYNISIED